MGKSSETVRDCPARHCKFYPYRFGKNPHLKGNNPKGNPKALKTFRQNSSGQRFLASNSNDLSQIDTQVPITDKNSK